MKRYPNGVEGKFFYEKNCPSHRPSWMKTAKVWSEGNNRIMQYCWRRSADTRLAGQSRRSRVTHRVSEDKDVARPTVIVFDLDPGAPANIVQCCQVGLWVRNLLTKMKLKHYCQNDRASSKGLQVYVPLNTSATFDQTKDLSRALAQHLEGEHGSLVTSNMSKALRKEKYLSIGARTTNTKQQSAFTVCAPRKSRPSPLQSPGTKSRTV